MSHPAAVNETQVQGIARQLLLATRQRRSLMAQMRDHLRWDDRVLAWAMENPGLRVQLFSLIDCLPALQSNPEIARHLQQYLSAETVELPGALKSLISFRDPNAAPAQLAATTMTKVITTLAQKYIAGETSQQLLRTVQRLRQEKMAFTIDLLGEAVITEIEAERYLQGYLDLMTTLAQAAQNWPPVPAIDHLEGQPVPLVQVSVKLTAFYSQFDPLDPDGCRHKVGDRLRLLLRKAQELGVGIHFDMEQYVYKDLTLAILKELLLEDEFRQRSDIGLTIQAYLRQSGQDLEDIIQWSKQRGTPITVRLVKGAYWDQETITARQHHWPQPVYNDKAQTDLNFEVLTQRLLEHHADLHAAIGSHNPRSIAKAVAIAEASAIPRRCLEFQMLYGMGESLAKAVVERGHRVRIYAPYGKLLPGMAYLIRRLLENTANNSFLKRNLEEQPIEALIAPPQLSEPASHQVVPSNPLAFHPAANTDYAQPHHRDRTQAALTQVRASLGQTYQPLIGGAYVATTTATPSVNPAQPDTVIGHVGQVSLDQAETAIHSAQQACVDWKQRPVSERVVLIKKAADLMENRRDELAAWICLEVGKILPEADAEVSEAIDFCRYYAAEMEWLAKGVTMDVVGETNRYVYQPRGIAVVIAPWNFPLAIACGMTVAALVTGNCTILKPATTSAVIAAKLTEILLEAGMPPGVFQFLPGQGSLIGDYFVKHPAVHLIAFTGSRDVGCHIYGSAAQRRSDQPHLKRVIAEMGGKNAIIVDESADLDQAVAGVVKSAFGYSGQKCSACSRVIVLDAIYDTFTQRLVEAVRSLNIGPADQPSTQVGPVIDAAARDRIQRLINQGRQEATLAIEREVPETGYFIGPTVFQEVDPHGAIAQQEIFGPVLALIKVKDFAAAIHVANDTDYALTGGLYSRTPAHIQQAKVQFEVGNLYINRTITGAIVARQPFGGFKLSGVGSKAGGPDYLRQFLEPRTITENIQRHGFAPIEDIVTLTAGQNPTANRGKSQ